MTGLQQVRRGRAGRIEVVDHDGIGDHGGNQPVEQDQWSVHGQDVGQVGGDVRVRSRDNETVDPAVQQSAHCGLFDLDLFTRVGQNDVETALPGDVADPPDR